MDVLLAKTAHEWLIAFDRDDNVLGGALVTIDSTWAMLTMLVGVASPIRYALHTDLVLRLGAAGVTYLFADCASAIVLPPGLQYLQRILGYEVVNLHI